MGGQTIIAMRFDVLLNLMRVKQALAAKYARLAGCARSKRNRERFLSRSRWHRAQAINYGRSIRLGTFVEKMDQVLVPKFSKSVIPIFQEKYHAMDSGGTGNLFRVGPAAFLFTASHVLDAYHDHGLALYAPRFGTSHGVQLLGHSYREKTLDIAAFRLSQETVEQLGDYMYLEPAHALLARVPLRPGIFYVYGFPKAMAFASVVEATMRFGRINIVAQQLLGDTSFSPTSEEYVWLHAFANDMDLNGISGCAVWQAICSGDPWDTWRPEHARIVAIETGTYRDHTVIEGTRIRHVFRLISQSCADLQPIIAPLL